MQSYQIIYWEEGKKNFFNVQNLLNSHFVVKSSVSVPFFSCLDNYFCMFRLNWYNVRQRPKAKRKYFFK